MKRLVLGILSGTLLIGLAGLASAKDLSTAGLEEAFIDGVADCGPSSTIAGALGKSKDPGVQAALRNALIVEAADDAAGVGSGAKEHGDCIQKELTSRGYTSQQMSALPYCVKNDWPSPFTSLGVCVATHAKLEAAVNKK
ncbi:MAG TPA: hypothetical protein VMH37_10620 [Candidatus Binataceae bacterium]|nr:hypothetical protein [Candidatus Binataceae bacterium]